MEDEFVIISHNSHQSSILIDVGQSGSHDPECCNESGRQHRPTGPEHALRYSEEGDDLGSSRSVREVPLDVVNGSLAESDPPGRIENTPGNLVAQFPRQGSGQEALYATM